jgi:uncharacterized protein with PQ loop repeat
MIEGNTTSLLVTGTTSQLFNHTDDIVAGDDADLCVFGPLFAIDPQGVAAQVAGYAKTVLTVVHAVPSAVESWRTKNPDTVPTASLVLRTLLSLISIVFGVLICQVPELGAGAGSLAVFLAIFIAKGVFRKRPTATSTTSNV